MSERAEIELRVINVIKEVAGNKDAQIKLTDSITDDVGLDSVEFASLIMALEDEFGGTVDEDRSTDLVTVKDIVEHILNRDTEVA